MKNSKQEEIIEFLRQEKRASTSKIAGYVGIPNDYALRYLNELLEKKLIIKEEETNAVYWKIIEEENGKKI
jgi:predicted HTH transcriptional regulator